jgi:hypothetical protein
MEAVDAIQNSFLLPCLILTWVYMENTFPFPSRTLLQHVWIIYFLLSFRIYFFPSLLLFLLWRFPSFFCTNRTESDSLRSYKWRLICLQRMPLYLCDESNEVARLSSIVVSQARYDLPELEPVSITVTSDTTEAGRYVWHKIPVYLSHTARVESNRVRPRKYLCSPLGCWYTNRMDPSQIELSLSEMLQR